MIVRHGHCNKFCDKPALRYHRFSIHFKPAFFLGGVGCGVVTVIMGPLHPHYMAMFFQEAPYNIHTYPPIKAPGSKERC